MKKKIIYWHSIALFSFTILLSAVISLTVKAQGNLIVTPKRIVFEGSNRSQELNLANTGNDSATYIISFIEIRMKDDGTFEKITEPDSAQNFADKNIRFFPRTVTLAPNEAQTVKVQITKTDELTTGEYRSHLYFRAVPTQRPLGENDVKKDSEISVKLIPVFGISIPVIIRLGESNTQVHFSDVSFQMENAQTPTVKMTFNRRGNMSVYGDVLVDYVSTEGKITHVGTTKGIALYTPNSIRHFRLLLENKSGINYHSGKLHLTYCDQAPKPNKIAEEELYLN